MVRGFMTIAAGLLMATAQPAAAAPVSKSTAAELAVHRIERLVSLRRIDESFMARFKALTLEALPNGGAGVPTFKASASQEADQGRTPIMLELVLDEAGKTLSHTVKDGQAATDPVQWPDKDAVTLIELALHHVDHLATQAQYTPYSRDFASIEISPANVGGRDVAEISVRSSSTARKLKIELSLSGDVLSTLIVD